MKLFNLLLLLHISISSSGLSYDSTAYTQCLPDPAEALYNGGIISNPGFKHGLEGWSQNNGCDIQLGSSNGGNAFLVARQLSNPQSGPAWIFRPSAIATKYTLSAWVQIKGANSALVKASIITNRGNYTCAGSVIAHSGCWSFLKGGFLQSQDALQPSTTLLFTTAYSNLEIWLDNVALQPFTDEQWNNHQNGWIKLKHLSNALVRIVDKNGQGLSGANIRLDQTRLGFPFGSAIASPILDNAAYQRWFAERFNTAVFENELKWYFTERQQGNVSYEIAEQMMALCKANDIAVRGHNIFWEDPKFTPKWVTDLTSQQLQNAVNSRIASLLEHFKGQFIQWDVANEMLHFSFYEDRLGPNASDIFFQTVQRIDPTTPVFMNEFNVIETCNDDQSTPDVYVKKLQEIGSGGKVMEGIGLEAHFSNQPNIPFMRAVLDKMGSLGMPIWLTELDIINSTNQASYLREVLREAYSHPRVEGIVMWSALHPSGCWRMCLTDWQLNNLPTGDVVDAFLGEILIKGERKVTDQSGSFQFQGTYGQYKVEVRYGKERASTIFTLRPTNEVQEVIITI